MYLATRTFAGLYVAKRDRSFCMVAPVSTMSWGRGGGGGGGGGGEEGGGEECNM